MNHREPQPEAVLAEINLEGCPEGPVLEPLAPRDEISKGFFSGWQTPLAPWSGFKGGSRLEVVRDGERTVLARCKRGPNEIDSALVWGDLDLRDYRVTAETLPIDTTSNPDFDRWDCCDALVGIVFRMRDSRHYYQFGIEAKCRLVLYRRADDEWLLMHAEEVALPEGYVTLEVGLDGDGIRCCCPELDASIFHTDTTYVAGMAGIRMCGDARLASLRISQAPSQQSERRRRRARRQADEAERSASMADAVLIRTLDLTELGGLPTFMDFAEPGRFDLLVLGEQTRAFTSEGELLWECPIPLQDVEISTGHAEHGRLIYGFTGKRTSFEQNNIRGDTQTITLPEEMVVLRGQDGAVLARQALPEFDPNIARADFSYNTGDLTGRGRFDIVLREWVKGGGSGTNVWAYDRELNLLWRRQVEPRYGHHRAVLFVDVDGDGRDDVLAGGTLLDPSGEVLWVHDLGDEMHRIHQAHHYDAVAVGHLADDPALDPVAFLLGSSAGVYVVDALTGRTRACHRVGHAQGCYVGKMRSDLPGQQVLVACRWGNYGILTLFSGQGDRLWSIQPDYIGQGSCPVWWGDPAEQLIWTNTSGPVQALYDGHGRRVKQLPELQKLWGDRMRGEVRTFTARMGRDPQELLCMAVDDRLYAFGSAGEC